MLQLLYVSGDIEISYWEQMGQQKLSLPQCEKKKQFEIVFKKSWISNLIIITFNGMSYVAIMMSAHFSF